MIFISKFNSQICPTPGGFIAIPRVFIAIPRGIASYTPGVAKQGRCLYVFYRKKNESLHYLININNRSAFALSVKFRSNLVEFVENQLKLKKNHH